MVRHAAGSFPNPAPRDGRGAAADAMDRLWVDVNAELRRVAHRQLRRERQDHTLSTTELIHEVYLKLAGQRSVPWTDRNQFFALAAQAMRRILVDYARRHRRLRDRVRYDSLDADHSSPNGDGAIRLAGSQRADELLELDAALDRLGLVEPRLAQVIECRFFAGYTEEETASALGVTARTVTRDWVKAKAWLQRELHDPPRRS
ncbi:MAG TPA: ECF-type sigma factor [Gemmatimonadaceae bacterium]